MKTKYQIIFIGYLNPFYENIKRSIINHIDELGVNFSDSFSLIYESDFATKYIGNSPTFCLYFGDVDGKCKNLDIIQRLLNEATLIIPVVTDINEFNKQTPEILRTKNGYVLSNIAEVESIVSCILEGLGLLRTSRRLFISYKRNESSSIAIQLYEKFEQKGFDVFLDTHSIRPGEPFQEELWHRMTDTDVIVFLNTPKFLESEWCEKELAEANAKSIGILQLIWPFNKLVDSAKLCIPYHLDESHFVNNTFNKPANSFLEKETIDEIVSLVESLRARSLASRQNNLISEFISASKKLSLNTTLQPEKIITQILSNGKERVFIPIVGIPQSLAYNQSEELIKRIRENDVEKIFLLFDHRSIREKWLNHLEWLDKQLEIKTTKIVGIEEWLKIN